jgi:hypothetical protein
MLGLGTIIITIILIIIIIIICGTERKINHLLYMDGLKLTEVRKN